MAFSFSLLELVLACIFIHLVLLFFCSALVYTIPRHLGLLTYFKASIFIDDSLSSFAKSKTTFNLSERGQPDIRRTSTLITPTSRPHMSYIKILTVLVPVTRPSTWERLLRGHGGSSTAGVPLTICLHTREAYKHGKSTRKKPFFALHHEGVKRHKKDNGKSKCT